jgi:hypothetical protein
MIHPIKDILKPYGATYAVVGGAAANLYLNRLEEIRDIDIKVCLRDMDTHDDVVLALVEFLESVIIRPDIVKSVGPYIPTGAGTLASATEFDNTRTPVITNPLRPGPFNLLVLPHDVRDTQTRILVRGRNPIGTLPKRHKNEAPKYKYVEYLDITIAHAVCLYPLQVEDVKGIPVLALHDLVREQILLLESPEFREGGRRTEERASKKERLRRLLAILTTPLSSTNAHRSLYR